MFKWIRTEIICLVETDVLIFFRHFFNELFKKKNAIEGAGE
jgi:hypothetical protein